jgi:hypothetical protein
MAANNSVYLRIEFDVADPAAFEHLELRMKYDDGFAAFLNGGAAGLRERAGGARLEFGRGGVAGGQSLGRSPSST